VLVFWPFNLLVGWVGAVAVWYATLRAAVCLTRWRSSGRWERTWSVGASVVGWVVGLGIIFCI
jgi:hypothetical protein